MIDICGVYIMGQKRKIKAESEGYRGADIRTGESGE
jgi:hypothetical protein